MDTTGFIVFSILLTIHLVLSLVDAFSYRVEFGTAFRQITNAGITIICLLALYSVAYQS